MSTTVKYLIAFLIGYWACSVGGVPAAIHIIGNALAHVG